MFEIFTKSSVVIWDMSNVFISNEFMLNSAAGETSMGEEQISPVLEHE